MNQKQPLTSKNAMKPNRKTSEHTSFHKTIKSLTEHFDNLLVFQTIECKAIVICVSHFCYNLLQKPTTKALYNRKYRILS